MPIEAFEPDSLEFKIVEGIFRHIQEKLGEGSMDVYRIFGVLVRGKLTLDYRIDDIKAMAEYIRENDPALKFDMIEYLPTSFYFDPR